MNHTIPYSEFYPPKSFIIDYLDGRNLTKFLPFHFSDFDAYQKIAKQLSHRSFPRKLISEALLEQNKLFDSGDLTLDNIESLKDSESFVVVGGQQTGLFGGPLYTLYKAITVIKLADSLSKKTGRIVLPIFWMASDDHDFAEVNHINLLSLSGQVEQISYSGEDNGKIPISARNLSTDIEDNFQLLKSHLPETEFRTSILDRLESAYQKNNYFADSFAIWLQHVLRDYGLIVINPSDKKFKQIAIPLFQKEIEEESPVSKAVMDQTEALVKLGYTPQLQLKGGLLNLFYHNPEREIIAISNGNLVFKDSQKQYSKSELVQILCEHPEQFSPNAALRPLFQDTLFPTLAIVLGPSELAYFAQLKKAYDCMDVIMPIAFPRTSVTLIEPKTEKILRKYHLTIQDIFQQRTRIINLVAEREIPKSMFSSIDDGEKVVAKIWQELVEIANQFDQNLKKPAEIAKGRSANQFDFLRKKLMQAARQKDETLKSQMQKLVNSVYPNNAPQERVFNLLPFYVRYGEQFIKILFEQIDIFNSNHQLINLKSN